MQRKYEPGDRVIATEDIAGWRGSVPKGSRGTVTEAGWGRPLMVDFDDLRGDFIDRLTSAYSKPVRVTVRPDQIAPAADR
jgi:hypothetical protein